MKDKILYALLSNPPPPSNPVAAACLFQYLTARQQYETTDRELDDLSTTKNTAVEPIQGDVDIAGKTAPDS